MKVKRIYLARRIHDVIFVSEESDKKELKSEAGFFLEEQNKSFEPHLVMTEITSFDQIPEDWQDALIWGTDDVQIGEITAKQFLEHYGNAEYKEYLRLKEKYEK